MKGLFVTKKNEPHNGVELLARYTVDAYSFPHDANDSILAFNKKRFTEKGYKWKEFETEKEFVLWHILTNRPVHERVLFEDCCAEEGLGLTWH